MFVRAVMAKLGYTPQERAKFARAMKFNLTADNPSRKVKNWLQGRNGPDYEATMAMLEATGWLSPDAEEYLRAAMEEATKAERAARRLDGGAPSRGKRATG